MKHTPIKWTPEIEECFTELRLQKLGGHLTVAEEGELSEIWEAVGVVETEIVAPALQKLESEQVALEEILKTSQREKDDLVQLLNQQALLIADIKGSLEV